MASISIWHPPFDSELRQSSLLVATFNLVATIVGGGVLSLPLAFEKCGIVGATGLMVFAATITALSLDLLCITARKTGAASFGSVGMDAFGSWMDVSISVLLFVFLLFVLVAYMVLLRDIWTPLVQLLLSSFREDIHTRTPNSQDISGDMVLLGILIIMSPCLVQRTLHALRFNCYIGFGSVSILCIALLHHALMRLADDSATDKLKYFPQTFSDALFAFPIITLSFLSAFNVLPIQNALIKPTTQRIRLVVHTSVICCFALMYTFGLAGYLYVQDQTKGNILLNCGNYKEDWMFLVGRIGCGITIMLALAMMMVPCRDSLLEVLDVLIDFVATSLASWRSTTFATPIIGEQTLLLSANNNHIIHSHASMVDHPLAHYGSTFGITLITYLGAVIAPGVAVVWSLCGSSMAFVISFLLPAACFLKLEQTIPTPCADFAQAKHLFSWFLVVFSVVGAISCTVQTVLMMNMMQS